MSATPDVKLLFGVADGSKSLIKSQLTTIVQQINADPKALSINLKLNTSQMESNTEDIKKKSKKAATSVENDQKTAAIRLELQWNKTKNKILEFYDEISATAVRNPDFMAKVTDLKDRILTQADTFESGTADANAQIIALRNEAIQLGLVHENIWQKSARVIKEKFGYGVAALAAMAMRQALIKVYNSVVDIDTAMTELRKVTEETSDTYDNFLTTATTKAKQLGAAIDDVVNATADFARLGYNIQDATVLAEAATVYKNVGDGIDDITEASESIISTMKAFGIEASDAMSIVDKFNEVGKLYCPAA